MLRLRPYKNCDAKYIARLEETEYYHVLGEDWKCLELEMKAWK